MRTLFRFYLLLSLCAGSGFGCAQAVPKAPRFKFGPHLWMHHKQLGGGLAGTLPRANVTNGHFNFLQKQQRSELPKFLQWELRFCWRVNRHLNLVISYL